MAVQLRTRELFTDTRELLSGDKNTEDEAVLALSLLQGASAYGTKLLASLPKVSDVLDDLERKHASITEKARIYAKTDPQVAIRSSELATKFQTCISEAKGFVNACIDMAKYGNDSSMADSIKKDLEDGHTDCLKMFLTDIADRLQRCAECLEDFESSQKEAYEKFNEETALKDDGKANLKSKYEIARFTGTAFKGLKIISAFAISAAFTLRRLNVISEKATTLTTGGGLLGCATFFALEFTSGYYARSWENQLQENANIKESTTKIEEDVVTLKIDLDVMVNHVRRLKVHKSQAEKQTATLNKSLESRQHLNSEREPLREMMKLRIMTQLNEFQGSMSKILEYTKQQMHLQESQDPQTGTSDEAQRQQLASPPLTTQGLSETAGGNATEMETGMEAVAARRTPITHPKMKTLDM